MKIRHPRIDATNGFTLIEVMISLAIGSLIIGSLTTLLYSMEKSATQTQLELAAQREADFALDRMVRAIEMAQIGFVPLGENPATAHSESVRSVLAVSMDPGMDRDKDGWSDANSDQDWYDYDGDETRDPDEPERIDEDPGHDMTKDGAAGIIGVDDDGDGQIDELMQFSDPAKSHEDDDEDGWKNDDPHNGYDDDNDGAVDEDTRNELNDDSKPGLANVDDNFDGLIDTHPDYGNAPDNHDDDEDGQRNEDGPEAVVYFVGNTEVYASSANGSPSGAPIGIENTLYERLPEAGVYDGTLFSSYPIASRVESFTVRRNSVIAGDNAPVFELVLAIAVAPGRTLSFQRTAVLGARR